jgi:hypothetical protein
VTCPGCTHWLDHCHGTLVMHADGAVECTDPACTGTRSERHYLLLPAEAASEVAGREQRAPEPHADRGGDMAATDPERHTHDAMVHEHEHWHVTHNWSETAGTFEHLAARHSHPHDHAELTHSHVPHVDFDSEHAGEAHVHDHDRPVNQDS